MKQFEGKVAAITGAGSGIGQALALALAAERCHLALSDIDEAGLADTARQAKQLGVEVSTHQVDVSQRQQMEDWAQAIVAHHGKVNMIFNNAGVGQGGTVSGTDYADYEWVMAINFWGVIYGTKVFMPYLEQSGDGHVVNISSVLGIMTTPMTSAYCASKFAVRGFTESLRQELDMLDNGVSATCVHPGGIKTNIAQTSRMSESASDVSGVSASETSALFEKHVLNMTPANAAKIILDAVRHNRRRVLVGKDAKALDAMQRSAPSRYQTVVTAVMSRLRAQSGGVPSLKALLKG